MRIHTQRAGALEQKLLHENPMHWAWSKGMCPPQCFPEILRHSTGKFPMIIFFSVFSNSFEQLSTEELDSRKSNCAQGWGLE